MSLLDNLPHTCTIRRRTRTKGTLAGSKSGSTGDQTGVLCWEQKASPREIEEYGKRGIVVSTKIYFAADPGVTEQHQIIVTARRGVAVASAYQFAQDVKVTEAPDGSAGMAVLWKVFCDYHTGKDD